jgi:hypothetical protein
MIGNDEPFFTPKKELSTKLLKHKTPIEVSLAGLLCICLLGRLTNLKYPYR